MRKKLLSDTMKMNSLLFSRRIKTIMILLTPDKESLYVNAEATTPVQTVVISYESENVNCKNW